jgi:hypothetical protein
MDEAAFLILGLQEDIKSEEQEKPRLLKRIIGGMEKMLKLSLETLSPFITYSGLQEGNLFFLIGGPAWYIISGQPITRKMVNNYLSFRSGRLRKSVINKSASHGLNYVGFVKYDCGKMRNLDFINKYVPGIIPHAFCPLISRHNLHTGITDLFTSYPVSTLEELSLFEESFYNVRDEIKSLPSVRKVLEEFHLDELVEK